MTYVNQLVCVNCGRSYGEDESINYCPICGFQTGILDVQYDYLAVEKICNPTAFKANSNFSMWRYLPLLPLQGMAGIQHLQVGWTPLYESRNLAGELGVARCFIKDDGRNPTASLKDRASSIGVAKAIECKVECITCASTGNAASSLAGFAAAAGLPAVIFVPQRAPKAKVAQLLVFGAKVFSVQGTYDQAWELCMQASGEFGWYSRNCAVNPYLIEGKKTVALELVEQLLYQYDGAVPDWVVVTVGDGCTVGGVWKGLTEMYRLGFLTKLPKILGVQAQGCQPFVTAWRDNTGKLLPVEANTLADSIAVGHPRNFQKGMNAILESQGAFIAVSDDDILWSMTTLARKAAVFGEPAGVAGIAGVKQAVKQGIIDKNESVGIVVTGNGLKDIESAIKAGGIVHKIEPDIEAVRSYVK